MFRRLLPAALLPVLLLAALVGVTRSRGDKPMAPAVSAPAQALIVEGRQTFRFDTFGDEDFWGGSLKLHQAVEGAKLGGVGPGVSPRAALKLGLKVDVEALPDPLVADLKAGKVNLDDPAPPWPCSSSTPSWG
jgi:hypothetical protein